MPTTIPAFWNNKIYIWTPQPGVDPSLLSRHLFVGALAYAKSISVGASESDAQIAAEKAAFQDCYGVVY